MCNLSIISNCIVFDLAEKSWRSFRSRCLPSWPRRRTTTKVTECNREAPIRTRGPSSCRGRFYPGEGNVSLASQVTQGCGLTYLLCLSLLPGSHKIGMGQRFKISPDIFYDIFPSQTEPMSPVQSWTEERGHAHAQDDGRGKERGGPHEAPATLQKYPSLLMDGIEESTRQGGRPGQSVRMITANKSYSPCQSLLIGS